MKVTALIPNKIKAIPTEAEQLWPAATTTNSLEKKFGDTTKWLKPVEFNFLPETGLITRILALEKTDCLIRWGVNSNPFGKIRTAPVFKPPVLPLARTCLTGIRITAIYICPLIKHLVFDHRSAMYLHG